MHLLHVQYMICFNITTALKQGVCASAASCDFQCVFQPPFFLQVLGLLQQAMKSWMLKSSQTPPTLASSHTLSVSHSHIHSPSRTHACRHTPSHTHTCREGNYITVVMHMNLTKIFSSVADTRQISKWWDWKRHILVSTQTLVTWKGCFIDHNSEYVPHNRQGLFLLSDVGLIISLTSTWLMFLTTMLTVVKNCQWHWMLCFDTAVWMMKDNRFSCFSSGKYYSAITLHDSHSLHFKDSLKIRLTTKSVEEDDF